MQINAQLGEVGAISAQLPGIEPLSASFGGGTYSIGTGGASVRLTSIFLQSSEWVGDKSPYSQVVAIEGVTANSKIDLQPSVEQLEIFYNKDIAFTTENNDGVVTVFVIGDKPTNDYTIQATIMEVNTNGN